jgi:hypothetical protein
MGSVLSMNRWVSIFEGLLQVLCDVVLWKREKKKKKTVEGAVFVVDEKKNFKIKINSSIT